MDDSIGDMVAELTKVVLRPESFSLQKDCQTWWDRCLHCATVHKMPHGEAVRRPILESRPFYRCMLDFMEINPEAENGEKYLLTFICVATRYLFLRACLSRDSQDCAFVLLDLWRHASASDSRSEGLES